MHRVVSCWQLQLLAAGCGWLVDRTSYNHSKKKDAERMQKKETDRNKWADVLEKMRGAAPITAIASFLHVSLVLRPLLLP
jgi:hypothetical protein